MEALALQYCSINMAEIYNMAEHLLYCALPVRLQRGAEQVLWLRDWRASAES